MALESQKLYYSAGWCLPLSEKISSQAPRGFCYAEQLADCSIRWARKIPECEKLGVSILSPFLSFPPREFLKTVKWSEYSHISKLGVSNLSPFLANFYFFKFPPLLFDCIYLFIVSYSVFQKSDAKIEITITVTNLIRIKYLLGSFNYHLSDANVAIFNKIHCTVFEQQLFKKWNSKTEVSNMEKSP